MIQIIEINRIKFILRASFGVMATAKRLGLRKDAPRPGAFRARTATQAILFSERLDDYFAEDSPARMIDVFIGKLNLTGLGLKTQWCI